MIYEVKKANPLNGRLIVDPIQSSNIDEFTGIELAVDQKDTVTGRVIRTSDEETFPVNCVVMYDRYHGKGIKLLDDSGAPHEFKVVQVVDVSLILLE